MRCSVGDAWLGAASVKQVVGAKSALPGRLMWLQIHEPRSHRPLCQRPRAVDRNQSAEGKQLDR